MVLHAANKSYMYRSVFVVAVTSLFSDRHRQRGFGQQRVVQDPSDHKHQRLRRHSNAAVSSDTRVFLPTNTPGECNMLKIIHVSKLGVELLRADRAAPSRIGSVSIALDGWESVNQ